MNKQETPQGEVSYHKKPKKKKPYLIECQSEWMVCGRYETEKDRNQALRALRYKCDWREYRAKDMT